MITAKDIIDVLPIVAHRGWMVKVLQNGRWRRAVRDVHRLSPIAALVLEIDPAEGVALDPTIAAIKLLRIVVTSELEETPFMTAEHWEKLKAPYAQVVREFAAACDDETSSDWSPILRALEVGR